MTTVGRLVPAADALAASLDDLRDDVRTFLRDQLAAGKFIPTADCWLTGWDESFSAKLAVRGWIGMTIPVAYGGQGRSFLERFVVTEELLAAGAPVAAHWIADRQIAPSLLQFGTETQKQQLLPRIARGECFFAIGMSEPDSGSDLASVRTKAVEVDGGWALSGTKVWTSGAHRAHAMIVLARSSPIAAADRRDGLSQFIVQLPSAGVSIRPIGSMNGDQHFNEVYLDDVFVPYSMVLGTPGHGWKQVTTELAFERSGPERFLSTFSLLGAATEAMAEGRIEADCSLGRLVARISGLHHMSTAVAGALQRHDGADVAAAVVKVLGTTTEGDIADWVDLRSNSGTPGGGSLSVMAAAAADQRPGFTLRGGTNEVLRGVIARAMGVR
jgi:alkylation response protein AidB-like acyl-CoA dehydrogenase